MAKSVMLSTPAQKQFASLDRDSQKRIRKVLERVALGGRVEVKMLKGVKGREDLFRERIRNYRAVYRDDPDAIKVIQVFHRSAGHDWL